MTQGEEQLPYLEKRKRGISQFARKSYHFGRGGSKEPAEKKLVQKGRWERNPHDSIKANETRGRKSRKGGTPEINPRGPEKRQEE